MIKPSFKNKEIPNWVNWLAQDKDGSWWGFSVEPHQHHMGWYENEIGNYILLEKQNINENWKNSLIQLKK